MQIIVFDSEFTAWHGSQQRGWSEPWEHKELIQLAALKLEVMSDGSVTLLESFNELVKPTINPTLSDYIVSLTGINQSLIEAMGVDVPSVLNAFYRFTQNGTLPCLCWGRDMDVLRENAKLSGMELPEFSAGLIDLRRIARTLSLPACDVASGQLANALGSPLEGQEHNALFDVRNICIAMEYWLVTGALSKNALEEALRQGASP